MIVLAAPVLDMRTWPGSGGDGVASSPLRQSFDIVAEEFGPGANTPMLFVADRDGRQRPEVDATVADARRHGRTCSTSPRRWSRPTVRSPW